MGKKRQSSSSQHKGSKSAAADANHLDLPSSLSSDGGDGLYVDPARIRFQHSRIRPFFSGCGRSVEGTLEEIRNGTTPLSALPPIQVLVGGGHGNNDNVDEPWYFSLNNRRLWVLKRLREEGLLEDCHNKVWVRVRTPKSRQERDRYTVTNCALEAKIVPEKMMMSPSNISNNKGSGKKIKKKKTNSAVVNEDKADEDDESNLDEKEDGETLSGRRSQDIANGRNGQLGHSSHDLEGDDDSDDEEDDGPQSNRFGALLMD